jgi:hypothetical protein
MPHQTIISSAWLGVLQLLPSCFLLARPLIPRSVKGRVQVLRIDVGRQEGPRLDWKNEAHDQDDPGCKIPPLGFLFPSSQPDLSASERGGGATAGHDGQKKEMVG